MSASLTVAQENALSHLARGIRDAIEAFTPEVNANSSVPALYTHPDGSVIIAAIKELRSEVKHYTGLPMGLKHTKGVFDAIVAEAYQRKRDAQQRKRDAQQVVDAFLAVPADQRQALLDRLQGYLPMGA